MNVLLATILPLLISALSLLVSALSFRRSGRWSPAPWLVLTRVEHGMIPDMGFPEDASHLLPREVWRLENIGDGAALEVRVFPHHCRARMYMKEGNAMRQIDYASEDVVHQGVWIGMWPADYVSESISGRPLLIVHWYESPARLSRCRCRVFAPHWGTDDMNRVNERRLKVRVARRFMDAVWHRRYHRWPETRMIDEESLRDPNGFFTVMGDPLGSRPLRLR